MTSSRRRPIRVLLVEDNDSDAELVVHELERAGYEPAWRRVQDESEFVAALDPDLDVILADFNLPVFSAPRALELLKASNVGVPMIVVSGSIGEETAVEVLHSGAADYLLKDRLSRLGPAVQRAIDERRMSVEKRRAEDALRESEDRTRFALTAARVGVWEADLRTGAARWSEMLEALHGKAPGTFGGTFEAFLDRIHPTTARRSSDRLTQPRATTPIRTSSTARNGRMARCTGSAERARPFMTKPARRYAPPGSDWMSLSRICWKSNTGRRRRSSRSASSLAASRTISTISSRSFTAIAIC
jgi:DNA-binding response OmpR family regulator